MFALTSFSGDLALMLEVGWMVELWAFDLNQEQFVASIRVSQSYLFSMERGEVEIGAEILLRISREFGKSMDWLLTGEK